MGQMTITAYTDENFSSEYKSALELPINPDKVKFTKGIQYAEDKQLGSLNGSNVYARYRPENLYFECLLDMTNALDDDREKKPVHDVVNDLEQRLYCYNSEGHRPSFVKVQYGDILFFGQAQDARNGIYFVRLGWYTSPRRIESDTDGLLQPEGRKQKIPETFARCVSDGHAEGRANIGSSM